MSGTSFISTTIPYVNAQPHLGHAFEYVQTDAYARHMALMGSDTYFLTGSDENSLKNVLAAGREGVSTQELVDRNVAFFEQAVVDLQLQVRRFIRTSVDRDHVEGAIAIWKRMAASGDIYSKSYEGLYCVGCEQFYTADELTNGKCPEHLIEPELVSERNYFFRLSRYAQPLLDALESGRIQVVPGSRLNEVTSFVRAGLEDISVSRSMERARGWGIQVPDDPTQVMYVWIDALTNYINALGWTGDADDYRRYWVDAEHRVHVVGKGVLRFHAVYWPAMLLSAGLPLPTEVVVHGYITLEGQKLSKSLGNAINPATLIQRYGSDAVRYYLLAEFAPFSDGDFSEQRLVARYNTDLANALGNLVSRVASMTQRYRGGVIPPATAPADQELALHDQARVSESESVEAMARYDHRQAIHRIWDLVRRTNAYLDERAPWHLAKAEAQGTASAADALDTTLHYAAGAVRQLGRLTWPYLPRTAEQILEVFAETIQSAPPAGTWLHDLAGRHMAKPAALFPRIDAPA
jgi:methionyl-tRNA synthetase